MTVTPVAGRVVSSAVATEGPSPLDVAVQTAFSIGWSVAVLANPRPSILALSRDHGSTHGFHLPTEHELDEKHRVNLEIIRLGALLRSLRLNTTNATTLPGDTSALSDAWGMTVNDAARSEDLANAEQRLRQALLEFNFEMLAGLASTSLELELAYQAGRSLRDTANPPLDVAKGSDAKQHSIDAWNHQLGRQRIARIQEWLKILNAHFPENTGIVVSTSLGKWSELGFFLLDNQSEGRIKGGDVGSKETKNEFARCLLDQGDVWLGLLTGEQSTDGLLTPESYVAAGEASLNRSARIIRRIVLHYWFALVVLAAAAGGVFYLAARDLGGAAKAWTQISAILSSVGISAQGIASRIGRLSSAVETPIYQREKLDAMAWSVTTFPTLKVSNRKLRAMRRSGIQRSRSLARG